MTYLLNIQRMNLKTACLYAIIAHAISLLKNPELDYEQSWDGINYSQVNGQGARGTVSFSEQIVVGVFRNENLHQSYRPAENYIAGADKKFEELAENETFQYLLDDLSHYSPGSGKKEIKPVITTAFWGEDELLSNDTVAEFKLHSDGLLDFAFLNQKEQKEYWKEYCELTPEEMDLVENIFKIKQNHLEQEIEIADFKEYSAKNYEIEGISACRLSLSEI
ncbi:hypothetical protein [Lactovum odontotermitis]